MTQFRTLPPFGGDQRAVAEVVRGVMDGKTNNTGRLTLDWQCYVYNALRRAYRLRQPDLLRTYY